MPRELVVVVRLEAFACLELAVVMPASLADSGGSNLPGFVFVFIVVVITVATPITPDIALVRQ